VAKYPVVSVTETDGHTEQVSLTVQIRWSRCGPDCVPSREVINKEKPPHENGGRNGKSCALYLCWTAGERAGDASPCLVEGASYNLQSFRSQASAVYKRAYF
jgi:hypothetical protein